MKKIFVAIILLLAFFESNSCFANGLIIFNEKMYADKYYKLIEKSIKMAEKEVGVLPNNLIVRVNIGEKYLNNSYSNGKEDCDISLNYSKDKPLLLDTMEEDLMFILWHELGHCFLGKKVFYTNLDWLNSLQNEERINKQIEIITAIAIKSLNCIDCDNKVFKVAPPIVVYHEMFADVFSLFIWLKNNKNVNVIKKIKNIRIKEFNNNVLKSLYASQFGINKLVDSFENNSNMNILLFSKLISQKGFLEYLGFISSFYSFGDINE